MEAVIDCLVAARSSPDDDCGTFGKPVGQRTPDCANACLAATTANCDTRSSEPICCGATCSAGSKSSTCPTSFVLTCMPDGNTGAARPERPAIKLDQ